MPNNHAAPACSVDIYPYEGGAYSISGQSGAIQGVSVSFSRGGAGSFQIQLAPGGPMGVNSRPSWAQIITKMSLVVIGMSRGGYRRIVMIGVAQSVTEPVQWGATVQRNIAVTGADFGYFFRSMSYYNLNLLTGLNGGAAGSLALPAMISSALLAGTPQSVGAAWFKLMAGPNGILANTKMPYRGTPVLFGSFMSTVFEAYPNPVGIPTAANFIGDEGSWLDKFGTFFQAPWYEMFLTTAPVGFYPGATAAASPVQMQGYPDASPVFVARVNPLPRLTVSGGSETAPNLALDQSLWNGLPGYTVDPEVTGYLAVSPVWGSDEVSNFYVLNPTILSTTLGSQNGGVSPFTLSFAAWINIASLHRYGYHPRISETYWFADPTGAQARANASNGVTFADFQNLVSDLSLRVASIHEPLPLMARLTSAHELRPDIMVGCTFTLPLYKDMAPWTFYIDSVSHQFQFGGQSSTTLNLSRGLPAAAYQDPALMADVLQGNAQWLNGTLQSGVPAGLGPTLAPFNNADAAAMTAAAAGVFAQTNPGS